MDKRSIDIRSDLEDLASRFLQGEIDYAPSIDRSDQDVERRIEEYYGIPFKEYIRRIRQRR